jgi:hypothetical protein
MTLDEVLQLTVGNEVVVSQPLVAPLRAQQETYQVQRIDVGTMYGDGDADITLWTMDGGGPVQCFASELQLK